MVPGEVPEHIVASEVDILPGITGHAALVECHVNIERRRKTEILNFLDTAKYLVVVIVFYGFTFRCIDLKAIGDFCSLIGFKLYGIT